MSPNTLFTLYAIRPLLTIISFTFSLVAPAKAAQSAPTAIAQAQSSITVESGDYILLGLHVILQPGEYVGQHTHGGPDLITVFEGEVINHKHGSDQMIKAGESWLDLPGEMHAVTNAGDATARLWASALLPKGDTSLAPSVQMPLDIEAGEYNLMTLILDFAPGAGMAEHVHGGYVLSYILEGQFTLLENGESKQLKAFQSWTEVPNAIYAVTNVSESKTRVAITTLLPNGAGETTFVSSPTAPAADVVSTTENAVNAENVPNSQVLPVLIGVGLLLITLAAGFYLRRRSHES